MNIDIHSHFFPLDAFREAEKYGENAPKVTLEDGRLAVVSGGGKRGNLSEGAYNAEARIKELDRMSIDIQALSPSPILLFYWDEPGSAAYFSRLQNEAIGEVVRAHPDRFVGFGSVPLQSIPEAISVANQAKNLSLNGLEIGTMSRAKPWTTLSLSLSLKPRSGSTCFCSSTPLRVAALKAAILLRGCWVTFWSSPTKQL